MTGRNVVMVVAALLSLMISCPDDASGDTNPMKNKIDGIFAELGAHGTPGAVILVKKNGQVVFQRGYGVKDLRTRTINDSQTNFRLASCTKQFTAMSVMLLVHDGRLRYDERLTDIFPDFPEYGRAVTIRNLLNHTSGLPDYEELMDFASHVQPSPWTERQQIRDSEVLTLLEAQKSGKFTPGTQWSYSNSGYVLLGLIVARVSKKPFEDFLYDRIFKPLKMNHTLAYVHGKNEIPKRSYGHSKEGDVFKETDQSATSATLGDGGVYSNLGDLSKWDDALEHHTLLSETEMQPALKPVKLSDGSQPRWASGPGDTEPQAGKLVSYGFAWFLDPYEGHPRMWHYGDTVGFKAAIVRFTGDKLSIILLANRSDMDVAALAAKIANLYLNAEK